MFSFSNCSSKTLQNTLKATKSARQYFIYSSMSILFLLFRPSVGSQGQSYLFHPARLCRGTRGSSARWCSGCRKREAASPTRATASYIQRVCANARRFKPRSSEKDFHITQVICELYRENVSIYRRPGGRVHSAISVPEGSERKEHH